MLLINLAIWKLFVDERNSFAIEERKNLDLKLDTSHNLDENSDDEFQFILQHNEKVDTNSLTMYFPEKTADNEQISTTIPMSTPIFQDMSPTNLVVKQPEVTAMMPSSSSSSSFIPSRSAYVIIHT